MCMLGRWFYPILYYVFFFIRYVYVLFLFYHYFVYVSWTFTEAWISFCREELKIGQEKTSQMPFCLLLNCLIICTSLKTRDQARGHNISRIKHSSFTNFTKKSCHLQTKTNQNVLLVSFQLSLSIREWDGTAGIFHYLSSKSNLNKTEDADSQ